MTAQVLLDVQGPLARITLSNPRLRNALTTAMYDQLLKIVHQLHDDQAIRLVVLLGASGAFAAGTDIHDLTDVADGPAGIVYEARMTEVQDAIRALRVPVVAIVEGPAVGGGLALAACCDLIYCTQNAVFGTPVARTLGNCISAGTIARLRGAVGRQRTNEMLLLGRLITAEQALAAGLITGIVEAGKIDDLIQEHLDTILSCAPQSLAAFKEIGRRLDAILIDVKADDVYEAVYGSDDFKEGVMAFLGKRPPSWSLH